MEEGKKLGKLKLRFGEFEKMVEQRENWIEFHNDCCTFPSEGELQEYEDIRKMLNYHGDRCINHIEKLIPTIKHDSWAVYIARDCQHEINLLREDHERGDMRYIDARNRLLAKLDTIDSFLDGGKNE